MLLQKPSIKEFNEYKFTKITEQKFKTFLTHCTNFFGKFGSNTCSCGALCASGLSSFLLPLGATLVLLGIMGRLQQGELLRG